MYTTKILAIGNELLIGDTVNTNASWIGQFLSERGFRITGSAVIRDDADTIRQEIRESMISNDLTVVTGGLGPTHDDVTKHAVAELFGVGYEVDEAVLKHVAEIFSRRGFELSELNRAQAAVPAGSKALFNKMGTAPGIWLEQDGHYLALLPGVPYEMKWIFEHSLSEQLATSFRWVQPSVTRYYRTAGVPESFLSERMVGDLQEYLREGTEIAYLPAPGEVTLRATVFGENREEIDRRLNRLESFLDERIGAVIYARTRDERLEDVLVRLLQERGHTVSTAESCTGGLLSDTLTNVPGSSAVVLGGVVAYANEVKENVLGVRAETLAKYGAVSRQVALEMVAGVVKLTGSDVAVSTTGVAGPGGGSPKKPVGTVWIGFNVEGRLFAVNPVFSKDRRLNKTLTVQVALETLRRELTGYKDRLPYQLKRWEG
jgi:nicotinamide-nucleotide amidase